MLKSGKWRKTPKPGWRLNMAGYYVKIRPDCKGEHDMSSGMGFCRNCDFALRPAAECDTGR